MWEKVKCTPGIITQRKTNKRVAPVTKLKLVTADSKAYWYNVVENLETRVTKVRRQSPISFPPLSLAPSIKCSASDDNNVDYNLVDGNTQMRNVARELIVRVSPPSPSHNECVRDINPQDLRHVEHINYLKDCDIGNFQLDFLPRENSGNVEESRKAEEKEIKHMKNNSKVYLTTIDNNLPPLNKLAQILKISSYVNEFLASTKFRMNSTVAPKEIISTVQAQNCHRNKRESQSSLDQISDQINNENYSMNSQQFENIDRVEKQNVDTTEYGKFHEKHVGFQGIDMNSTDAECLRLQRSRAPSLGVASAVPSFGKILSSLENSDSTASSSLKDNSVDDNRAIQMYNYSQPPRDFLKVPKQKIIMGTDSKNIQRVHGARFNWSGSNSHLKQDFIESTSTTAQLSDVTSLTYKKKFKQWPKQSISHVIKALRSMKRRKKVKTDGNHEIAVPLTYSANLYENYDKNRSAGIQDKDEQSTTTTNLTSSGHSDYDEFMKDDSAYENKMNLLPAALGNINMNADHAPMQTTMQSKDFKTGDTVPAVRENKSEITLNALPEISAMYARKKSDKCLACLDRSIKIFPTDCNKSLIFNRNITSIFPVKLQNAKFNNLNNCYGVESISNPVDASADVNVLLSLDEQRFPKISHGDDINHVTPISSFSPNAKIDQNLEKKNITSKSFVSTLSLASERSKTTSDQDDSDQTIDDTGMTEEGMVESKSKFLAPCHAPLNLRPSLEPLKALYGKKTRSIQSRMASLEKTADHSFDEESDDNEIPITISQIANEKKIGYPLSKSDDKLSDAKGECEKPIGKFKHESEFFMLNKLPLRTSYTQLKTASLILDDIYSQLNINKNMWDYNPSDSFQPMSPIIPISEIIQISLNSLNENKNVIETLKILENEYTKRILDKNSLNSKLNSSNINKIIEMTKRLLALLIDSKLYLNLQYSLPHLNSPSKQKNTINSRQLRKVLPVKSYNLIAPILGLSPWHPKHWSAIKDARKLKTSARTVHSPVRDEKVQGSISKNEFVTELDLIVHPPSQRGSGLSEASNKFHKMKRSNPYATFLIKPRRKAVIWRELTKRDLEGYDPEATLKNRAAKVTDKICLDFCQWLRSLGGFNTTINEDILKNMFETVFTAEACKTMQVSICEMPVVPAVVAGIRNCPEADEIEILRKELRRDLKAEKKTTHLIGFGTNLPQDLRFVSPKNHVKNNWFRCENVPKDSETIDTIWNGIRHLDSVKGFTKWLEHHPDHELLMNLRKVSSSRKSARDTS